jgi:hypothetical protein
MTILFLQKNIYIKMVINAVFTDDLNPTMFIDYLAKQKSSKERKAFCVVLGLLFPLRYGIINLTR